MVGAEKDAHHLAFWGVYHIDHLSQPQFVCERSRGRHRFAPLRSSSLLCLVGKVLYQAGKIGLRVSHFTFLHAIFLDALFGNAIGPFVLFSFPRGGEGAMLGLFCHLGAGAVGEGPVGGLHGESRGLAMVRWQANPRPVSVSLECEQPTFFGRCLKRKHISLTWQPKRRLFPFGPQQRFPDNM